MEIEAEIEDAVAPSLTALDDSWHERTNAETLYTDGDLTLAAYAAALQVVTAYSTIDRQPLDRDLYRKLAQGRDDYDARSRRLRGAGGERTAGARGLPARHVARSWRRPSASMSACSTWRRRGATKVADFQNFAKSFAYGDYTDADGLDDR